MFCIKYLSFYEDSYKAKDYDHATVNWRKAYATCPHGVRQSILVNGTALVRQLINKNKSNVVYRKALIEREKDTDTNAGNAVDTYLRLAQVVETSPNRDELTAYLPVAYSYVGTYYVNNKRMADAVAVFKKWLAIEPDNQSLKEFIQQFDK